MARSARSLWTTKLKGGVLPTPCKASKAKVRADNEPTKAVTRGVRWVMKGGAVVGDRTASRHLTKKERRQ